MPLTRESWWRHEMETFSALLVLFEAVSPARCRFQPVLPGAALRRNCLWGGSTGHRWIPLTKASDAELWCFLWFTPEQTAWQTTEQSRRQWFETPSRPLWRHCTYLPWVVACPGFVLVAGTRNILGLNFQCTLYWCSRVLKLYMEVSTRSRTHEQVFRYSYQYWAEY